ncbi:hypothetical protein Csa_023902, partial [Cucumis sativus]
NLEFVTLPNGRMEWTHLLYLIIISENAQPLFLILIN